MPVKALKANYKEPSFILAVKQRKNSKTSRKILILLNLVSLIILCERKMQGIYTL